MYRKALFDSFFESGQGSISHYPAPLVVHRAGLGALVANKRKENRTKKVCSAFCIFRSETGHKNRAALRVSNWVGDLIENKN